MSEGSVAQQDDGWVLTDPDARIELAEYSGVKDNKTIPLIATYRSFFDMLSEPDPYLHTKDGRSYMIGPCPNRRSGKNLQKAYIGVLDADKSLDAKLAEVDGAPSPVRVHEVLCRYDISHCIYSTFSHGSVKGNRYRVLFPVEAANEAELKGLMVYMVEILQNNGLPIALSRESYVWGQGWYLPRVAYEGAEYVWRVHYGKSPVLADLATAYGFNAPREKMAPAQDGQELHDSSPLGILAKALPVQVQLETHGYEFVSQGIQLDQDGHDVPVLRYRSPGSASTPGVVVFQSRNRWRVYSHHTNDPLNNGYANDACDVYMLLNNIPTVEGAIRTLVPVMQDYVIDELQTNYPSILEHGTRYRYGNRYVDDMGAASYRMMDQATFTSAMQNQPGVPVIQMNEEGEESVKMISRDSFWRGCRDRVVYNGLCYSPCPVQDTPELLVKKAGKPYFNMFREWHIVPAPGRWELLEWHLRHAICGSNEEEYTYLLNWFSHLFQFPFEKPGVALVLQGGRGWGKSMLLQELASRLGQHAFIAGNNRLLTGNFNSHLRNKLLLVVEESFWSGNHKDRGVLQHIVTDEITGYEQKGVDAESGVSYLRVAMISNEDWVAPAATDERRYFLPSLTDVGRRQKELDILNGNATNHYFIRLQTELKNGGLEAFADFCSKRKLDRDCVRVVPVTEKLREQKSLSLDWIDQWIRHVIDEGNISAKNYGSVSWTDQGCIVGRKHLIESLAEFAPKGTLTAQSMGTAATQLGLRLKKMFGSGLMSKKRRADGTYYQFSSITMARSRFDRYSGLDIDWVSPDAKLPETDLGGSHGHPTSTGAAHWH